mmetsp:Transcript_86636/g.151251  ORF Transcript_86636/g.151251 Transcript_86636/m.151251 type:complete len:278 (-) Transcript_86636:102-935(-)
MSCGSLFDNTNIEAFSTPGGIDNGVPTAGTTQLGHPSNLFGAQPRGAEGAGGFDHSRSSFGAHSPGQGFGSNLFSEGDPFDLNFNFGFTEDDSWQLRSPDSKEAAPSSKDVITAKTDATGSDQQPPSTGDCPRDSILINESQDPPCSQVLISDSPPGSQAEKEFSRSQTAAPSLPPPGSASAVLASLPLPAAVAATKAPVQVLPGPWDVLALPGIQRNEAANRESSGIGCSHKSVKRTLEYNQHDEAARRFWKSLRATAIALMEPTESSELQRSASF